jgi:hypothetical protein
MVVSDMVFSLLPHLIAGAARGKRGFSALPEFVTGFVPHCSAIHYATRATSVSFAQIIDMPGKTIRGCVRFGISVSSFGWSRGAYSGNFD